MKVVYTKTIIEKMEEEIIRSYGLNKKIEEFIFSDDEWDELCTRFRHTFVYSFNDAPQPEGGYKAIYKGIPIFVE